jgi:carbon-monoxide dehydrogenase medium subunit
VGSLCSSMPFFDLPPALIVLQAEVRVTGSGGERTIPIDDFFLDYFTPALKPGEILREVVIPRQEPHRSGAFRKLETNSVDWALASVAITVGLDRDRMKGARIALGGAVGPTVVRALRVEEALEGRPLTEEAFDQAAELVGGDVNPHSDFRASSAYRLEIYRVYIRRCIVTAIERMAE